MSNQLLKTYDQLQRSFQNIQKYFLPRSIIGQLLPAFAYTADILNTYLIRQQDSTNRGYCYNKFKKLYESFQNNLKTSTIDSQALEKRSVKQMIDNIQFILKKHRDTSVYSHDLSKTSKSNFDQKKKIINNLYRDLAKHQDNFDLDSSYQTVLKINNLIKQFEILDDINMTQQKNKLKTIQDEYQQMEQYYMKFQQDWKFDKEQEGVKFYLIQFQKQNTIAIKLESQLDIDIRPLIALATQFQLFSKHVPMTFDYHEKQLKNAARNKKAFTFRIQIATQIKRTCHYYGCGYNRLNRQAPHKSIFIYGRSYQEDKDFQKLNNLEIQVQHERQRQSIFSNLLKIEYCCINIQPILKNKVKFELVLKANFKEQFFRLDILRRTGRCFAFNYLRNIINKANQQNGQNNNQFNWKKISQDKNKIELYILLDKMMDKLYQ